MERQQREEADAVRLMAMDERARPFNSARDSGEVCMYLCLCLYLSICLCVLFARVPVGWLLSP
jgi:hypothetical protein